MRASYAKDVRRIVEELETRGWRIVKNKHWKAYAPDGSSPVCMAVTPSDRRALLNIRSVLRRRGVELSTFRN